MLERLQLRGTQPIRNFTGKNQISQAFSRGGIPVKTFYISGLRGVVRRACLPLGGCRPNRFSRRKIGFVAAGATLQISPPF
jgi:hypothetical protein